MLQTASIAKLPVYGRIRPSLHGCTRVVIRLETARVHRCRRAGRDGNRTRVTAPVTRLHTVPGGSPRLIVNLQILKYNKANVRGYEVPAIISKLKEDIKDSILNGDVDGDIVTQPSTCALVVDVTM